MNPWRVRSPYNDKDKLKFDKGTRKHFFWNTTELSPPPPPTRPRHARCRRQWRRSVCSAQTMNVMSVLKHPHCDDVKEYWSIFATKKHIQADDFTHRKLLPKNLRSFLVVVELIRVPPRRERDRDTPLPFAVCASWRHHEQFLFWLRTLYVRYMESVRRGDLHPFHVACFYWLEVLGKMSSVSQNRSVFFFLKFVFSLFLVLVVMIFSTFFFSFVAIPPPHLHRNQPTVHDPPHRSTLFCNHSSKFNNNIDEERAVEHPFFSIASVHRLTRFRVFCFLTLETKTI